MGYDTGTLHFGYRLERHNSAGDVNDDRALERFTSEVSALIDSDPSYARILGGAARWGTPLIVARQPASRYPEADTSA